jgi:hypothetical protein
MYVFGIAIAPVDQSPLGHASAALREELSSLFPEHKFEFLVVKDMPAKKLDELLFRVIGAPLDIAHQGPSTELVGQVQAAVDQIVASARALRLN